MTVLFVMNVRHWAFIGDDAYISFRYARNLVDGQGLTWNPGERVEGYTNFLWVLLVAAGIRLGLEPQLLSQALGIVSGFLILGLLVGHGWRRHGRADPWIWLPPALLAVSRSFTAWSTGGLETQFFALAVLAGCMALIGEREREVARPWRSALCFAVAALTRPEGLMFAAVAGGCLLVDVRRRRGRLTSVAWWALPLVLVVGSHLLWRWSYYGSWLPNTFHAKVNGFWWDQGLRYLALFAGDYSLGYFAPVLLLPLLLRRSFETMLWTSEVAVHLVYVAAVGGDRFEFRFLVFVLPAIALLLAEGIRALARFRSLGRAAPALAGVLALAALAATWTGSVRPESRRERFGVASVERIGAYATRRREEGQTLRAMIRRGLLPADLRIAVMGAGALPYFTGWYTIDYFGLNDATVARSAIAKRGLVGHEHSASVSYMRERGVVAFDALNQLIFRASPPHLENLQMRIARAVERQAADPGAARLAAVCLRVEGDWYLVFATPLRKEEAVAAFPRLEPCPPAQ